MKFNFKRVLSFAIALVMILGLMPTVHNHVHAADATGTLSVTGLSVTYDKLAGNSSSCKLNGTSITATAQSNSGISDKTAGTTKITFTNTGSATATVTFSYTGDGVAKLTVDSVDYDTAAGSVTKALAAGTGALVIEFSSEKGSLTRKKTATLSITDVALSAEKNVTVTFKAPVNGTYTIDGNSVGTSGYSATKKSTESFAAVATPASGYSFFGWYNETTGTYLSYKAIDSLTVTNNATVYPEFIPNTTALFDVGGVTFYDLTKAGQYAASGAVKTIVLLNNGTVSGSHTIPAGVTLLVPFNDSNTLYRDEPESTSSLMNNAGWVQPTAYRTLTLAADAHITVNGAISISGKHAASNGGKPYCGAPTGPVGWVKMLSGSQITLNNGANLYVWGFIQGAGTITANSGATVYENFQFTDFRGGTNLTAITGDGLVFPINQYYVQNIEVPVKFYAGSNEKLYTSAYVSPMPLGGVAPFIGEGGMFRVTSGYIVKDYIENRDRMQVDVYGDITMSSMSVEVSIKVDSSTYVMPITNNVTVNLHSGTTTVQQSVALLPGAEMTVGKDAVLSIAPRDEALNGYESGGYHLIVYDRDEWFYGLDMETGDEVTSVQYAFGSSITGMYPLPYAPGRTYNRTKDNDLKDAVLDVNGKIVVYGGLYTTLGGGNIHSSEGTGVIEMVSGSGPDMVTYQANGGTSLMIPMNSAALKNGDGSYVYTGPTLMDDTISATPENTTYAYCNMHGWHVNEECAECTANPTFQITWVINGGSTTQDFDKGTVPEYKGNIGLPTPPYGCYSYAFAGWSTEANGGGTKYPDGTALPAVTGDTTYYAYYTETVSHSFTTKASSQQATAADCNNAATYYVQCDNCDAVHESKTVAVGEANGHTPAADDGNCETAITCSVCGTETTAAKTHVDGDDKNHVCDNDGCNVDNVDGGHHGGTATCQAPANCDECGQPYGEKKADNHTGELVYTNKGENHVSYYPCCQTEATGTTDSHTYDATTHMCVCGEVEKFIVTFDNWLTGEENVELFVPYGANIMEALKAAAAEGKIPAIGDSISVNDEFNKGMKVAVGYRYVDISGEEPTWTELTDEVTMPAGMLEMEVDVLTYGWWYNYNKDGDCVGVEYCDKDGNYYTSGWYYIEEDFDDVAGGAWYYFVPGTGEWADCFNFRAEDITLATKDGVEGYYAFDHETGKWMNSYTGIYKATNGDLYYVENGIAVESKGLVRVFENGEAKYYYFGCGNASCTKACDTYKAQKNTVHWVENNNDLLPKWDYTFGADGVIVHDDALNNNEKQNHEIVTYEGVKYYTIDGIKVHMGMVKIGEYYYYVRSSGKLVVNQTYWCSDMNDTGFKPGSFAFDEEGRMLLNGIVDGYYYVDGVRTYAGLIKIGNDYYYVRTNGTVATGRYWITKTNGLLPQGSYEFGEDGKMVLTNGIQDDGYYYKNGNKYYAGLIEIDGNYYYVNSSGKVIKNQTYWITKTNGLLPEMAYTFDADGKLVRDLSKAGIVSENGGLYYYENGVRTYKGLIKIGEDYYYVNSKGQVIAGKTYWITKANTGETGFEEGAYTFDEDGKMIIE